MDSERRDALVSALRVCGDVFLCCAAARISMEEFNVTRNHDPVFAEAVKLAELEGKEQAERIKTMREVTGRYDQAVEALNMRAKAFRQQQAGQKVQMGFGL